MTQWPKLLWLFPFLTCSSAVGLEVDSKGTEFFEKKIRPVLAKHCYECHSEEADELGGNLALDTKEGILEGGDNGPAVIPGEPDDSFLMRVIRYEEDDYQMPPNGRLSEKILADFAKWIEIGAPDPRKSTTE